MAFFRKDTRTFYTSPGVQVWLREHNRLCEAARADPANSARTEEELFTLVQRVVIAKLQKVVLEEFLPSLGISQADLEAAQRLVNSPDTSTEFSMAYRCAPERTPAGTGRHAATDAL